MSGIHSTISNIGNFGGLKNENAKRFLEDLGESFELEGKRVYFKNKLKFLPAEWYETIRDDMRMQNGKQSSQRF